MASNEVGDGDGDGEAKVVVSKSHGSGERAEEEEEEEWREVFEWEVGFPVAQVWEATCEFGEIDKWAPTLVASCSIVEGKPQEVGCVRFVQGRAADPTAEPARAHEKLLEFDPAAHKLSYVVLHSSIPSFVGLNPTFHLLPSATSPASYTTVRWSYRTRPLPSTDQQSLRALLLSGFYQVCISDLISILSSSPASGAHS